MTNSKGGGGNIAAVTYEHPEGLSGMKEAEGDNDNDDNSRGERQGQEEAEGAKRKCQSFITPWPFDNHYEEVLEARYEELVSHAALEYGAPDNNRTEGTQAVAMMTRRRTIGQGGCIARGWEGEGRLTTRAEGGEDDEQQGEGRQQRDHHLQTSRGAAWHEGGRGR